MDKKPLLIRVNPMDNVEIVVDEAGIRAGTILSDDLTAVEDIPQGHKIALQNLEVGDTIIRYGEVIGYAKSTIQKGSWIDETLVVLPAAKPLEELSVATKIPEPLPVLEGQTFLGYRNKDGRVGTKNMLGITTSVQCVEGVLNIAVEQIKSLLPNYPNVDGIMPINHNYGCGVAINAPEAIIPIRTLRNLSTHPNFGG
ncbi:MAG: galactarate dehydratase, partial [Firmicutes bacterium HGW-Firmicutes-5]